jgi:arginine repressor
MAKRMKRGQRSEAIREYLSANPSAGPKDVIAALKEKGVAVTVGLVSNIKYGGKKAKVRRGRRMTVRAAARRTGRPGSLSVEQLLSVKQFADSFGGVDQLRQALNMLEQLA